MRSWLYKLSFRHSCFTKRRDTGVDQINRLSVVLLASFLCVAGYPSKAQHRYRALFLGNSYTSVNNLPQLIRDVALSAGDTLIFDSHAPGGYRLSDHNGDPVSQNKIISGGWDYVIIQGQSQEPVILPGQFSNSGLALYNLIKQYNPCAVAMPYMTWGRKNGDPSTCAAFPLMCTYQGMDTTIRDRYLDLTASINGEVSPVSVVWNYLRQNHPGIELYQADESHPSVAGSYAAACCFYATIFKKDPTLISFHSGLNAADAAIIQAAVKTQVYDSLHLWDFKKLPVSSFGYQVGAGTNEIILTPLSQGVRQTYFWDFGDGTTSSSPNPVHSYLQDGTYTLSLTTTTCDIQGYHTSFSDTTIQFCSHTPTIFTSRPWLCRYDTLWTQPADSYQWLLNGIALPETSQYLADYSRYGLSGFSVQASLNGCRELSATYTKQPEASGYYFDAIGDPCAGDTVAFAVLHISSSLSGTESILWYKNGALLPWMTDEDTLWISTSGVYECKVVNPNAACPFDTTAFRIDYDCDVTGIEEKYRESPWTVSPNPATEAISITFSTDPAQEYIQIYNTAGRLMRSVVADASTLRIDIADWPGGLYYIRFKNGQWPALKFIKW